MGKVRPSAIKRIAKKLITLYPNLFTTDFEKNKELIEQTLEKKIPSKPLRNRILGYVTHLKRLEEEKDAPPPEEEEQII